MKEQEIRGHRILLLGYGREGKSTHQFLTGHYAYAKISVADRNNVNPLGPVDRVFTGPNYLNYLGDFDTVIRSPGIAAHLPALKEYQGQGGHVTSATNIFFSMCPGQTIGVTGTKGKSTTSALISEILRTQYPDVQLVGNIGNPALDSLDSASKQSVFVIELSSHQLEDARYSPHIAVVLNIIPEHTDYYDNFSAYQRAKSNIVAYQNQNDAVVFNPHHPTSAAIAKRAGSGHYQFALSAQKKSLAWIDKGRVFATVNGKVTPIISVSHIPLKGNLENILAALAVGILLNVPPENIRKAITAFQPLPHRLEFVGRFKGITFYNDSLATVPEATIHGLEALGRNVETLIAGGFNRGLDYAGLGEYLMRCKHLKTLILFPDTGDRIWQAVTRAAGGSPRLKKFDVSSMEKAVNIAYRETSEGKICLLSPAAASFNLFRDYAERGEQFKQWVKRLCRANRVNRLNRF